MDDILFGMETELAFSALQSGMTDEKQEVLFEAPAPLASAVSTAILDLLAASLLSLARKQLCSLPDGQSSGVYLENGSRLYLDAGCHPEFCTPECRSPEELVRWQLADERILVDLADELMKVRPDCEIALFRCNVGYGGNASTWGCHESYQHTTDETQMSAHLIPHLVSRIVYTGAGGLNNRQEQTEFLLSPRVPHLLHDVGEDSQSERSLYHTKNEPLSHGDFNRLHLLCGESNSSQLATYLKFGTTALIVRLIDAGVCRGDSLRFESPRSAMNAFARDPKCHVEWELGDGRHLTAVQIQREYLMMAEEHLAAEFMPDWAPLLCERWRRVLDQLETDPSLLSTSLDWAIKYALFQDRVSRSRSSWSELKIESGLGAELCEIDTRFGELGQGGLFHKLDHAGVLDHRLPELGSIEDAMTSPPPGGRAEVRGRAIREMRMTSSRYRCSWEWIHDREEGRMYDMSDPFGRSPGWRAIETYERERTPRDQRQWMLSRQLDRGIDLYNDAQLSRASELLEAIVDAARSNGNYETEALARFWRAAALRDLGNSRAAEEVLAPVLETALGPDHLHAIEALDGLARHLLFSGRFEESVPFSRRLLEIREAARPVNAQLLGSALNNLASSLVELREYAEAEPMLIRATELRTDYPNPHYWLAQIYQRRSERDDARREIHAWRRYLEIGPTNDERKREGEVRLVELEAGSLGIDVSP